MFLKIFCLILLFAAAGCEHSTLRPETPPQAVCFFSGHRVLVNESGLPYGVLGEIHQIINAYGGEMVFPTNFAAPVYTVGLRVSVLDYGDAVRVSITADRRTTSSSAESSAWAYYHPAVILNGWHDGPRGRYFRVKTREEATLIAARQAVLGLCRATPQHYQIVAPSSPGYYGDPGVSSGGCYKVETQNLDPFRGPINVVPETEIRCGSQPPRRHYDRRPRPHHPRHRRN